MVCKAGFSHSKEAVDEVNLLHVFTDCNVLFYVYLSVISCEKRHCEKAQVKAMSGKRLSEILERKA